ncbi:MAG: DNA topoisomerase, partial [Actinomycetota bacterium]|nr:DNA topoisomerase [Actinomycetota bacterium]
GYQRAYVEGGDEGQPAEGDVAERRLPALAEGDGLDVASLEAKGHETSPPARYTEASLVKALEELGVGRPSTYAATIATIQDRGYVWKRGTALVPSFTAFAVVGLLERHFAELVDYAFTARMEDDLDDIAGGEEEMVPWLTRFYFGHDGDVGLKRLVSEHLGDIDARDVSTIPIGHDPEGAAIVARVGKYGPYLQRGEDKANIPEDTVPDELTPVRALELLEAPSGDRVLGDDPDSGLPVIARAGRYGPYVQLGEVDAGSKQKPHTAALLSTMTIDTLVLDEALRLLQLPRVVGSDPADGLEIAAHNGRYGPYLKKGSDSRSLDSEEELFSVTLERALKVFAQPKQRRGQSAAGPLRELGADPISGRPVVLKEGRFGPYVTDGETNASLRKGDTIEGVTSERAAELLQDRRTSAPTKAPGRGRPARAKKAAKKAPARKKKSPAAKKGATPNVMPPPGR